MHTLNTVTTAERKKTLDLNQNNGSVLLSKFNSRCSNKVIIKLIAWQTQPFIPPRVWGQLIRYFFSGYG